MSSDAFQLVSSDMIAESDLESLFLAEGGRRLDSRTKEWAISRGDAHVWIFLGVHESADDATRSILETALGGTPRTTVSMEVQRTVASQQIAIGIALRCMQSWTCVVDDCMGGVLTRADLERVAREGRGFGLDR